MKQFKPEKPYVENGYDYNLQVWVQNYIIQCCAHPKEMRHNGPCCNQFVLSGRDIRQLDGVLFKI